MSNDLRYVERPADGTAAGALVLFHGRGADENDLVPLLDALDPERRLDGFCPRGPLDLPPGGAHWYKVERVGYPHAESFAIGYEAACKFVDGLTHERIVLGGFSQGAVLALAVGLGAGRRKPAAVVALSGFLPEVEGWALGEPPFPPVAVVHGLWDPLIPLEFAHKTRDALEAAGVPLLYHESPMGHSIDIDFVADELVPWISGLIG